MNIQPQDMKRLKARVAFLSLDDSTQPNLLSGAFYFMRQGFENIGCEVVDIFPVRPRTKVSWLAKKVVQRLTGKFYHWDREPAFLEAVGRIAGERIKAAQPDFVIAVQSQACAYLKVDAPLVLTHDQTFLELQSYFPFEPRPRTGEYVRQAIEQERASFENADLIAYPSDRSCETIAEHYGVHSNKLIMVPWGGNVPHPPSSDQVDEMIHSRRDGPIHLTAIGVHWQRKGADVILDAYRALRRRGADCRLTIIGMTPPAGDADAHGEDKNLQVLPFLDKSDPEQVRRFDEILAKTHFLIAPSRVEAFGHIFSEAAAFGVPTIASNVGGIPTSIEDGKNGRLLPLDATGEDYARAVEECHSDQAAYGAMARASRARFERDLNWPAFCRTIVDGVAGLKATAGQGLFLVGLAALLLTGQSGPEVHA